MLSTDGAVGLIAGAILSVVSGAFAQGGLMYAAAGFASAAALFGAVLLRDLVRKDGG